MIKYKADRHVLLHDLAHRMAITPAEIDAYKESLSSDGVEIFEVEIPDWPPVPYSPVDGWIIFGDVWWEGRLWEGIQPAIHASDADLAMRLAGELAGDTMAPIRVAYVWGVEIHDPENHIPMRAWLASNELSIVDFLVTYLPRKEGETGRTDYLVETTNPDLEAERASGSYSPTRRCVRLRDLWLLEEFAGRTGTAPHLDINAKFRKRGAMRYSVSPLPAAFGRKRGAPLVLREPREVRLYGEPALGSCNLIVNGHQVQNIEPRRSGWRGFFPPDVDVDMVRAAYVNGGKQASRAAADLAPRPAPKPATGVTADARVYSPPSVVDALTKVLGRSPRLFGQAASDTAICALTREGLDLFLREDQTDHLSYIADRGGRNYDCENFSETLRNKLVRQHGINGCAVIWGDGHAWCGFVVVGEDGPGIVMVEPQTDRYVEAIEHEYAVTRRCEVLL